MWRGSIREVGALDSQSNTTIRNQQFSDQCCKSYSLNPDPESLNPYPDPAFQVNPDPVPDSDPGFWWSKIWKQKSWQFFLSFFWLKITVYLFLRYRRIRLDRPESGMVEQALMGIITTEGKQNFKTCLHFFKFKLRSPSGILPTLSALHAIRGLRRQFAAGALIWTSNFSSLWNIILWLISQIKLQVKICLI